MILAKASIGMTVILILVLLFSATAAADTTTYHIKELYMDIDIPYDGYVITRDITADDPALAVIDMTKEELLDSFVNKDIYLRYVNINPYYEIDVRAYTNDEIKLIENFGYYSDFDLMGVGIDTINYSQEYNSDNSDNIETNIPFYLNEDIEYTDFELYSRSNIKYIVLDGKRLVHEKEHEIKDYITIFNGQFFIINLTSYNGPISDEMATRLKTIAYCINFTHTIKEAQPLASAPRALAPIIPFVILVLKVSFMFGFYFLLKRISKYLAAKGEKKRTAKLSPPAQNDPNYSKENE